MEPKFKTIHLAIDIQQSFYHTDYWVNDDFEAFKANELALIDGLSIIGIPTIQVFHIENEGVFSKLSGHTIAMEFMPSDLETSFEKHVHNAITDSGLQAWLNDHNVRNIIISGIRSEQCCETTTRIASDFGYKVDYITEATLTFPMLHQGTGRSYSTDEIKQKTELVLQNRFAEIHTVTSVLTKYR